MRMVNKERIMSWKSARKDRISLPYADDSYVTQTVYDAVFDTLRGQNVEVDSAELLSACDSALNTATVVTLLDLRPSQDCPCVGFTVEIDLADGQRLERRIRVKGTCYDAIEIIDEFFSRGANGLDDTVKDTLTRLHREYLYSVARRVI